MSRKIHSFWRLLLGSFITLLGFAACKTAKKAQQGDDLKELYGPPPVSLDKRNPVDRIRVLYGVPPVRVEIEPELKNKN